MFVCVQCRERTPDGWMPKVGGVCVECALERWRHPSAPPAEYVEPRR